MIPFEPPFSPAISRPDATEAWRFELPRAPDSASARCTLFSSSREVSSYSIETIGGILTIV